MDRQLSSESVLQRLVNWKSCELGSKSKKDKLSVQLTKGVGRNSASLLYFDRDEFDVNI